MAQPQEDGDRVGCDDNKRFQLELEFVQCLANPHYLNWLAQNRYFEDPAFVKYLDYLTYWKRPDYAKYIVYPHALFFLDLLQYAEFRSAIANTNARDIMHTQQFRFWQHYRANRIRQQGQPTADGQEA